VSAKDGQQFKNLKDMFLQTLDVYPATFIYFVDSKETSWEHNHGISPF